ncbi:hypothetical protein PT974_01536 [Cladobotryum mycophilum]|uniref:Uncharacterized protein n=1 Tax=Cladobotryum mycophilum TaxID=491253 RepID=A0ABR0T406_9HYPO
MAIFADVTVGPSPTPYYGTLVVSNIRNEDGSPVSVSQFLGIAFKSPAQVSSVDVNALLTPWSEVTAELSSEQVDKATYAVAGKLLISDSRAINSSDTFNFGINGDLTQDPDLYVSSFKITADEVPNVA